MNLIIILSMLVEINSLIFTYFNTPTFTDLQGWSISCKATNGNFIGIYNSLSYAGLGYVKSQDASDALYKAYYNLPPHSGIRLSATFYICGNQSLYNLNVFADHTNFIKHQTPANNLFVIEKVITQSGLILHTSDSVLFRIQFFAQDTKHSTIGVRDLKIEILECPSGCQKCEFGDYQSQCNIWQKLDYGLSGDSLWNFNNDGWIIDGVQNNQIFSCDSKQNFNFFGLYDQNTKIIKSFILPPHYQIQIELLIILVQTDFERSLSIIFEMDDQMILEYTPSMNDLQTNLCKYYYLSRKIYGSQDVIARASTQVFSHYQQNMKLRIFIQQRSDVKSMWGLRDFKIYLKKCHVSCTQTCTGPLVTNCLKETIKFTTIQTFFDTSSITTHEGWDVLYPYSDFSICNAYEILGGYQLLQGQYTLSYTISQLKKHSKVSLTFSIYYIETFANEKFSVYLNDVKIYEETIQPVTDTTITSNYCGGENLDIIKSITISNIDHNLSSASLTFKTNQASTSQAYWGIRGIIFKVDDKVNTKLVSQQKGNTATGWYYIYDSPLTQKCTNGNFDVFGLFQSNAIIKTVVQNMPSHKKLNISFKIMVQYTTQDSTLKFIELQGDGNSIWKNYFSFQYDAKACDSTYFSMFFKFEVLYSHTDKNIMFQFFSDFQDDYYWGIREFKLEYL